MKENIIKFIIIALTAFFSASMAYCENTQQIKYPCVERIEIGYSPQAFSTDSLTRVKNAKVIKHAKDETENGEVLTPFGIFSGFFLALVFFLICALILLLFLHF